MDSSIIYKYFPNLSEDQKAKFDLLGSLYEDWNQKINVVSRKDIDELFERHVLHSLAIAKFLKFTAGSRILDIGTGGGFPGIPLAIFYPDCEFHLVDSIAKKIRVVTEVAAGVGLNNVKAEHNRAEKIKGKYTFIVSRAVAQTKQLLHWTNNRIETANDSGYLLLKGGDLTEELSQVKRNYVEQDISEYFDEPFFETKKVIYIPY